MPSRVHVTLARLLLASGMDLPLPAHAGARARSGEQPVPGSVTPAESGPQALKQHVRVTVETNAPPAGAATNTATPNEKSFNWKAAWVNGPFSVQGEFLHSSVHEENGQVPAFNGFYASVSWFLTGESRPCDRTEGMFGRVIPKRNFDFGRTGWGAWEMAARYSFVDLDSADIHGGRLSMLMAGVNWHLHSHVKWRFDYGFGHVSGRQPDGNLNVFQTRLELDF